MTLKLTTLSENGAGMGNFLAEWGLSILVETEANKVLLDTGASVSAVHNADVLGIDLTQIDAIVLSHGHSDHTGGLREVLRRVKIEVKIIAHPDVFQSKYDRREGKSPKFIGIPFQKEELESLGARFLLTEKPTTFAADIMTTGEVPMVTDFESVDPTLFVKEGSEWRPDLVLDDQALIVKIPQGLVVIAGCAHRGLVNTLYHARQITGVNQVYAVFGGSHLIGTTEERLWQTIGALKEMGVQKLGLCHCTDLPAASVLVQEFGQDFIFNRSGTIVELP